MSAPNPNRVQLHHRGKPVVGVWHRQKSDGTVVYEFLGRLGGKLRRVRLDASSPTEAVRAAGNLRSAVNERRIVVADNRRMTVAVAIPIYVEYVTNGLAGTKGERSPRSIEDIEMKLRRYVAPALGHLPLSSVTEQNIRDLARSAARGGKSKSTVSNVLATCGGFFSWGVRERLVAANPVSRAREVYGRELLPDTEPKAIRALTDDEIARAMEFVGDVYVGPISLCGETGLRISETLGLTYARLDLEAETITVAQQLAKDGTVRVHTKTRSSREIPITPKAAATLRAHRAQMAADGHDTSQDALVFVTRTGKPQDRRNVLRAWQSALDEIGVEGAGLHSLRHSFVSRLAEQNVPVAQAAELVGHARIQTTLDTYTRVRGGQAERIEQLREALSR